MAQRAAVVDHRRARAVEHPDIIERVEKSFSEGGHGVSLKDGESGRVDRALNAPLA
jgi:hypothetical protein